METEKTLNSDNLNRIIDRAKQNDREATAVLIEYFYHKILTYIFYRVNNREDAEDLTQEVFLKMIKSLKNQNGNFTAWLYKIASNHVIDFYKHRSVQKEVPLDEIDEVKISNSKDGQLEAVLTQEQFRKNLAQLTDEQREVIILKFIQGHSNAEISEIMNKSIGAVKLLQFRALERLRKLLQEK